MKTKIKGTIMILGFAMSIANSTNVWANDGLSYGMKTAPVMMQTQPMQQDAVMQSVSVLQKEWAVIKYQIADKEQKLNMIHDLEKKAAMLSAQYPDRPEPKIWEGIILSTDAGIVKGLSALGKVDKAKALFEKAMEIDPSALDGSAYTSLGSLYYQVPGWPISFGDDDKAENSLKKALSINAYGIDPNFFYGDFLMQDGRYEEAKKHFNIALQAPNREGRELADAGRRQEIKAALAKIMKKGNDKENKANFNE